MLSAAFLKDLAKICESHSIGKLCGCRDEQVATYIFDNIDSLQKLSRAVKINAQLELHEKMSKEDY